MTKRIEVKQLGEEKDMRQLKTNKVDIILFVAENVLLLDGHFIFKYGEQKRIVLILIQSMFQTFASCTREGDPDNKAWCSTKTDLQVNDDDDDDDDFYDDDAPPKQTYR